MASFDDDTDKSILDRLDSIAPIREFDAFPKVANNYTQRTSLGGIATLAVVLLSFLLSLNDVGDYMWGWPDFEYGVDKKLKSDLDINVDMVVNMPCNYLTIDVRDAVGDRLHLTSSLTRDGTAFDPSQAHRLQSHGERQSTSEIVTAARKKSAGLFGSFQSQSSSYRPTYNHVPSAAACRIYGTIQVKRVTGNLHVTTLGHGYSSREHTEHKVMNLTHLITEFSFGPYFPNIAQPLDYTYEVADDPFTQFQYFVTVVPTTYHAPRSAPLMTNQYSVTSYRRTLIHGRGTPGIFFKFDIDPLEMTIWQRTTSFSQFLLRLCGVVGGVWTCAAWALKVTAKAATVVVGKDKDGEIVNEAQLRKKASRRWTGADLRARSGSSPGWQIDGASPYNASFGSPYAGTPTNGYPMTPMTPANGANGHTYSPVPVPMNGNSHPSTPGPASPYTPGPAIRAPLLRPNPNGPSVPPSPSTPPQRSNLGVGSPTTPYVNGGPSIRPKSGLNPAMDKRID